GDDDGVDLRVVQHVFQPLRRGDARVLLAELGQPGLVGTVAAADELGPGQRTEDANQVHAPAAAADDADPNHEPAPRIAAESSRGADPTPRRVRSADRVLATRSSVSP